MVNEIIPERGTLFILNKCELDEDDSKDQSKEALRIFKTCVNDTMELLKCRDITALGDDEEDTSDIETMVSELCNYPFDVIINKRKVEHKVHR